MAVILESTIWRRSTFRSRMPMSDQKVTLARAMKAWSQIEKNWAMTKKMTSAITSTTPRMTSRIMLGPPLSPIASGREVRRVFTVFPLIECSVL